MGVLREQAFNRPGPTPARPAAPFPPYAAAAARGLRQAPGMPAPIAVRRSPRPGPPPASVCRTQDGSAGPRPQFGALSTGRAGRSSGCFPWTRAAGSNAFHAYHHDQCDHHHHRALWCFPRDQRMAHVFALDKRTCVIASTRICSNVRTCAPDLGPRRHRRQPLPQPLHLGSRRCSLGRPPELRRLRLRQLQLCAAGCSVKRRIAVNMLSHLFPARRQLVISALGGTSRDSTTKPESLRADRPGICIRQQTRN